jgi:hypothetical protein
MQCQKKCVTTRQSKRHVIFWWILMSFKSVSKWAILCAFYAKVTYITFFEGVKFLATLHISMFLTGGGEVVKNNFLRKTFSGTKGTNNLQVFNHLNLAALHYGHPLTIWFVGKFYTHTPPPCLNRLTTALVFN